MTTSRIHTQIIQDNMTRFARVINEIVRQRNWNTHALVDAMYPDMTNPGKGANVYRIMRGKAKPSQKTLKRFAAALHINESALVELVDGGSPEELAGVLKDHRGHKTPELLPAIVKPRQRSFHRHHVVRTLMEEEPKTLAPEAPFTLSLLPNGKARVTLNFENDMKVEDAMKLLQVVREIQERDPEEL